MLAVDFINVGYGDAVLIREYAESGGAFTMLVDCGEVAAAVYEMAAKSPGFSHSAPGEDAASMRVSAAEFLQNEGIERLDLLVITHLHLDHVGGLANLPRELQVSELWCNYVPEPKFWGRQAEIPASFSLGAQRLLDALNIFSRTLHTLSKKGTLIRCMSSQTPSQRFGEGLEISLFCEHMEPSQDEIWRCAFDGNVSCQQLEALDEWINDTSLRLRISYAGRSVELPGDYSTGWEHSALPCTILKLPHHGHPDSLTEPLAAALRADYTVISVSNSRTDCPAEEIAMLSKRYSPHLLFTDAVALPGVLPAYHASIRFLIADDGQVIVKS